MSSIYITNLDLLSRQFRLSEFWLTPKNNSFSSYRTESIKASLFEGLMFYDSLNIKMTGPNIPLAMLVSEMGVKGVEELIEQGGLSFTQWDIRFSHVIDPGSEVNPFAPVVQPVVSGRDFSSVFSDPEESIVRGLGALPDPPSKKARLNLIKKVGRLYDIPERGIEYNATDMVLSAFQSNKLLSLGFDKNKPGVFDFPANDIKSLRILASEITEYKYLSSAKHTSTDNYKGIGIFLDCAEKLDKARHAEAYSKIVEIECVPDFRSIFDSIDFPLAKVCKLRDTKNARNFRVWLDKAYDGNDLSEISKTYIDSLVNSKGFFERRPGRLAKTAAMALAGAGVGAVAGPAGALVGGAVGTAIPFAADFLLDLVDEFALGELGKGWTPRMFIDEIKAIKLDPKVG